LAIPSSCRETLGSKDREWVTCHIAQISRERDTYVGQNVYGARTTVARTRGEDFSIAVRRDSPYIANLHAPERYLRGRFSLKPLEVPIDVARTLGNGQLAMLVVGRIIDARIVDGWGTSIEPTVRDLTDIIIQDRGVPFEVVSVMFYAFETGEMIKRIELAQ